MLTLLQPCSSSSAAGSSGRFGRPSGPRTTPATASGPAPATASLAPRAARGSSRRWCLAIATLGVLQLNATGLANKDAFYTTPESVVGEQVLAKHFPAGSGHPVLVLANTEQAATIQAKLETVQGVSSVADPIARNGRSLIETTLSDAPDSDAATKSVDRIRDAIAEVRVQTRSPAVTPLHAPTRCVPRTRTTSGQSRSFSAWCCSSWSSCCEPSRHRCSSARSCSRSARRWA